MHNPLANRVARAATARHQGGVVLYVALVVMVVMMLAGVALLRSAGTGQGVAGNMAFKQNATSGGELGVNQAASFIKVTAPAALLADIPAEGYFSTWGVVTPGGPQPPTFDPFSFAWGGANVKHATLDDGTGNRVDYVIERLCTCSVAPGEPCPTVPVTPNACVVVMDGLTLGTAGGGASATSIAATPAPPYYRVTTRTVGPRNTVSYTQVVMK